MAKEYITMRVEREVVNSIRKKMVNKSFNVALKQMMLALGDYEPPQTDSEILKIYKMLENGISRRISERLDKIEAELQKQ